MQNLLRLCYEKILLLTSIIFRDDYHSDELLTYSIVSPPSIGELNLKEDGSFTYSVDTLAAIEATASYIIHNQEYSSNEAKITFRLIDQPLIIKECSYGYCTEKSLPFNSSIVADLTTAPAPDYFKLPQNYSIVNFKENLTVTTLTSTSSVNQHECTITGLTLGDKLPASNGVNFEINVKRTHGQTRDCTIELGFDNDETYKMILNLSVRTN